jgi:antirestriction protein
MSEGEPRNEQTPEQQQSPVEQAARLKPQVWIASLSDYNAGRLHGAWVAADQEPDGIWEDINEVLASSPEPGAEEWAIHDYDGFGPLRLSEYESVERLSQLGLGIAEHGEPFAAYASVVESGDELVENFSDSYLGHWESLSAYAEEYLDDIGIDDLLDAHIPESVRPYVHVDSEGFGNDMASEGSVLVVPAADGSGVHVFMSG